MELLEWKLHSSIIQKPFMRSSSWIQCHFLRSYSRLCLNDMQFSLRQLKICANYPLNTNKVLSNYRCYSNFWNVGSIVWSKKKNVSVISKLVKVVIVFFSSQHNYERSQRYSKNLQLDFLTFIELNFSSFCEISNCFSSGFFFFRILICYKIDN